MIQPVFEAVGVLSGREGEVKRNRRSYGCRTASVADFWPSNRPKRMRIDGDERANRDVHNDSFSKKNYGRQGGKERAIRSIEIWG
jgi:hypothetical protein